MKKILVIAAVSSLLALPATGFSQDAPYVSSTSGGFVKDSSGNCVRTSSWFEGSQVPGCDVIEVAPVVMAPADADGDGVPDSKDACRSTPQGVAVDMRGCPLDSDGDGVADMNDQCPGTIKGQKVDSKGCAVVEYKNVTVKMKVQFQTNSDEVTSDYEAQMKAVAYVLGADPKSTVVIKGHTDSTGAAAYNKDLSQRRANAVAKRLVEQYGVAPGQISAEGYGEDMPVASNNTAAGRLANRRVEADLEGTIKK
ncbi:MAG: OOP family OmpA-OmpF porin [Motiliproteus sp.]|jgi:OOP family OmpA-OmpF porin